MAKKRIGVMTSGGDSHGMNSVVRAVVRMAIHMDCEAYFVHEGYDGLVQGGSQIEPAGWGDVRGYLAVGGTLIGSARCMAFYERPGRLIGAKNLILSGIDALVICGGDGSLTGADRFRAEWPSLLEELVATGQLTKEQVQGHEHLNIVGLVGSIDNDLSGTDATIGAYSALARICELIDCIHSTAASHRRAFVIEVMGRHCGWLALMAGVATGADFIFIPEKPSLDSWQNDMTKLISKHRAMGKRKTIVVVAEGARDKDGNAITPDMVRNHLADKDGLCLDSRVTTLGHVQRGGPAVAFDRILATLQGVEAVKTVLDAKPGDPTYFIAINENDIVRKPLMEAVRATQQVAKEIEAKNFDKAMALRDTEFAEMYHSFEMTSGILMTEENLLPPEKRMRIGFMNVGAPAGGMNAALRAGVAYCIAHGHVALAMENGFAGYTRHHDDESPAFGEFDWTEVDNWASFGGSEIGTNRELPSVSGFAKVASYFKRDRLDALFIVGGFEAFHALSELRKAQDQYPEFCIPICLLPATISNNVPGSEYSLGSDTCLNELVEYCDKVKQSASATRRRVFVVETQGAHSGYPATLGALGSGATAVYIPEEGISLPMLSADVEHLKEVFANDKGKSKAGRLVLVNEKVSKVLDARHIHEIIQMEAGGRFQSRFALPGHIQQGGVPSSMDRCRAVRLAIRCMAHLEKFEPRAYEQPDKIRGDPSAVTVIGIHGSEVRLSPMKEVEENDTDWQNRRPMEAQWLWMKDVADIMGGRPKYPKPERPLVGLREKDIKRGL